MTAMRFEICTLANAQALPRVLEHFALRTLMPQRVEAIRDDDRLIIFLEIEDLDEQLADLIAEKIRASVMVLHVTQSLQLAQSLDGI